MKKHQTYLVLLLAVLFSGAVNAKVNNYVGLYGQLAEWSLMPSQSAYRSSLGVTGGAGFVYEMQAGSNYKPVRFLMDVGVGAWGGMTAFRQHSTMTTDIPNQVDLSGEKFDYVYEVNNRHDQYKNLAVQIPLMVGMQYRRFYMLAGVKIDASMLTKDYATGEVTTYGRYEAYDNFYNQPDYQFFNDKPFGDVADAKFNLNMDVSLEVGGRLGLIAEASGYDVPKRNIEYRIAGFIDYGVMDIRRSEDKNTKEGFITPELYDTDKTSENYIYQTTTMIDNLKPNDLLSTKGFASRVNNFMIGIKFTVLFQLPEERICVLCRDAYRSSIRYRGGGMQFEE